MRVSRPVARDWVWRRPRRASSIRTRQGDTTMNTTPSMTLERTDAAASGTETRFATTPVPATGSFRTVEPRIEVTAPLGERYDEILTPEALEFLAELHDRFAHTRHELLAVVQLEAPPRRRSARWGSWRPPGRRATPSRRSSAR